MLRILEETNTSLDICMFTITDTDLVSLLIKLHETEQVGIRIIADLQQSLMCGSKLDMLRSDIGIPVRLNLRSYDEYLKVCV
jgi:hypothetical protein